MSTQKAVLPAKVTVEVLNNIIVDAIQDIKGKNIVKIDLSKLYDAPADFFIVCEGESNVQVRAITDSIRRKVKEIMGIAPYHLEGGTQSTWVVMDYFETVVHIFHKEARLFYELEALWSDGTFTQYDDLN